MKETNILLLDFNPSSSLGKDLRSILASDPSWTVELRQLPLVDDPLAAVNRQLTSLIKNLTLRMVFLMLPPSLLQQEPSLLLGFQNKLVPWPLIVGLEEGEPDALFALLERGAADFITPPLTPLNTLPRVRRLLTHANQRQTPLYTLKGQYGLNQLIGQSEVFRAVVKKIPLVARSDANVLISGETGTGKELCARAIHYLSPRTQQAFVPVNCGAIPTELVESELFGHEQGAFTTAVKAQAGLIAAANGGTFFLDEIDCLSLTAQVKLLRFLQEKEYRPLGSVKLRRADTRVIAAANVDFDEAVSAGRLRQDLYYRLSVIPVRLPPLRERREDIPLLALHFLGKFAPEFNQPRLSFSAEAMQVLQRYEWPGNVRELEHLIAGAVALAESDVIEARDLNLPFNAAAKHPTSFREAKGRFERSYIEDLLLANRGNITRAAQAANKNRRAFWELIRRHHIDANRFKGDLNSELGAK